MDRHDWLVGRFEAHRPHLRAIAGRILGSPGAADAAVWDAAVRLSRADTTGVGNLRGWLTMVVARVCFDTLRSRRARRAGSVEVQVPDPILSPEPRIDPRDDALLADSVGLALLAALEALTPAEQLAFVLHDMFGLPFEEIAPMLGHSPAVIRQLVSRARLRVRAHPTANA
jgi:RNA polymerase sigma factor (sigma-70 family)